MPCNRPTKREVISCMVLSIVIRIHVLETSCSAVVSFCLDEYKQSQEGIMTEDLGVDGSSSFTYYDENLLVMVAGRLILGISGSTY